MNISLKSLAVLACAGWLGAAHGAETSGKNLELDRVAVAYEGISDAYAQAIARTVATARSVAVEQFGFDLPEKVFVSVKAGGQGRANLYTDGQDHIFLSVSSEAALRQPAVTGTFHLYGLCHELGHMAMYRAIAKREWLSSAGAEGWAHYAGSRLLDQVFAREGDKLWPDAYNYLEDGTARLRKQLAAAKPNPTTRAAGLWMELGEVLGDKGPAKLFATWGQLEVDPANPAAGLGPALLACGDKTQLEAWWKKAQPVLIETRAKSDFAKQNLNPTGPLGPQKELAKDDGAPAGKRSMAGSGHAVRFEAPGKNCYLTAVRVYGARYGQPTPPRENACVWLCDADFKPVSAFPFAYGSFARGEAKWVTIPVKATRVPEQFIVCVGFNPTATKGVFVHYDSGGSGSSLNGLPGQKGQPFTTGDWMIRAVVQEAGQPQP